MFKYVLLLSVGLFSQVAWANSNCIVTSYRLIDQQSESKTVIKENANHEKEVVVIQKPPLRCAMVKFRTHYYQPRVADAMRGNFIATYVNGREVTAHTLSFPGDQVQTGYINIGPQSPAKAYICFTHSKVPIESIECTLRA